jgi:RNA polymerase sigma-70 factor, ECF subfamily
MTPLFNQKITGGFNRRKAWAIKRVYDLWYDDVFDIIDKLTDGSSETEDLTANIFDRLLRRDHHYETLDDIRSYLFESAKNRSVDWLRHEKVKKAGFIEINYRYPTVEEPDLERSETHAVLCRMIDESIEKLSRQCRNVFRLWYKENLTNGEIAKRLGMSEKTVSNQKSIALQQLKMEIEPRGRRLFFTMLFI